MPPQRFELADLVAIREAIEELRQKLLNEASPDQRRIKDLARLWGKVNDRLAESPPRA